MIPTRDKSGMILVVEGISGCGKSTWCASYAPRHTVAENGRFERVPDRIDDPVGAARFWAQRNVDRWQAAIALESTASIAVCDTDPLKLHYIWCLWRIREASEGDWLMELAATRETIAQGHIGFADCYIVDNTEPRVARERALADKSRRRRNFELHARLQPALLAWYASLDVVLPGRVQVGLPSMLPSVTSGGARYDLATFDRLVRALPGTPAPA